MNNEQKKYFSLNLNVQTSESQFFSETDIKWKKKHWNVRAHLMSWSRSGIADECISIRKSLYTSGLIREFAVDESTGLIQDILSAWVFVEDLFVVAISIEFDVAFFTIFAANWLGQFLNGGTAFDGSTILATLATQQVLDLAVGQGPGTF